MTTPRRQDEAETPSLSGPLSIILSCPQCGAPAAVEDDAVSAVCDHCASFLIVARPGRDEIFLAERTVSGAEEVRRIVIAYRVQARRAELLARYGTEGRDGERIAPPEIVIEARLKAFEEDLLRNMRVVGAHCVEAPYWHMAGAIVQGILGRFRDGAKEMRLRAFAIEHTVPGYSARSVNLRDRGLRLARSRVRPFSRRDVADRGPFLPWVEVPDEAHREMRRWEARDLDPGIEPITKRGALLFGRRFLIYRSYWLARIFSDQGQSWVLVDGSFGTIAGYPSEVESRALIELAVTDPEDAESRETKAVVRPARCPDCGFEASFDRHSHVVICTNCHLALEPRPKGIRLVPYDHADAADTKRKGEYLPFWVFGFEAVLTDTPVVRSLEAYAKLIHPRGLPPGFDPRGECLFVPAFRLLGTEAGDECFKRLVEWIHGSPPEIRGGKVLLGGRPSFHGVTVSESDARSLLPHVLYGLHDTTSAARLNTLLVRKTIDRARLGSTPGRLVMVSFVRGADGPEAPERALRVPRQLLDGRPELEAQRVTVHRAAAAKGR